jgi:hypothetical protein
MANYISVSCQYLHTFARFQIPDPNVMLIACSEQHRIAREYNRGDCFCVFQFPHALSAVGLEYPDCFIGVTRISEKGRLEDM